MLCGLEPRRHPRVFHRGNLVGSLAIPEPHLYVYTVQGSSGRVSVDRAGTCAVIGSGRELEGEICQKIHQVVHFGSRTPELHWARALLITEIVASMFAERQSATVRGPFHYMRILTDGSLLQNFTWPGESPSPDLLVRRGQHMVEIRHPSSGEKYALRPLWDWSH